MYLVMIDDVLSVMPIGEFIEATFSPESINKMFFPLKVSGKTYAERKEDLEKKAKEYQNAVSEFAGLSWGEFFILDGFFEKNAKRYGLLEEFRENGII